MAYSGHGAASKGFQKPLQALREPLVPIMEPSAGPEGGSAVHGKFISPLAESTLDTAAFSSADPDPVRSLRLT